MRQSRKGKQKLLAFPVTAGRGVSPALTSNLQSPTSREGSISKLQRTHELQTDLEIWNFSGCWMLELTTTGPWAAHGRRMNKSAEHRRRLKCKRRLLDKRAWFRPDIAEYHQAPLASPAAY